MIRLVTMSELEKLQTLPVGYTGCLKNKEKRGKCIGNGWTIDVIAHILSGLKKYIGYPLAYESMMKFKEEMIKELGLDK